MPWVIGVLTARLARQVWVLFGRSALFVIVTNARLCGNEISCLLGDAESARFALQDRSLVLRSR